ncbi:MAG: SBBP repeat-containing protein [Methanobacterium sp.]|nr:SBBP repeat-containing protein [Methanobacterium sp.]
MKKQIKRCGIPLLVLVVFVVCFCGVVTAHDTTYPIVTIDSPKHNSEVNGTVHVNATVDSHTEITKVVFNVSDGSVFTDFNGNEGWSCDWDTSNTPNGQYSVKATVHNSDGLTGSYSILVNVNNTVQATQLSLTDVQAMPNQEVNLNALLKDASDKPLQGKTVQFSVNGTTIGTGTTDSSGVATYAYTPTGTGIYNIQAIFNGDLRYGASEDNATLTSIPNNPFLEYSTYLGGNLFDKGRGLAVDNEGNIYIAGQAQSTDFPTTSEAYQKNNAGSADVFVAKFKSTGEIIYCTLVGGTGADTANSLAIDSEGNAYVTGFTSSTDFPTTAGAYQTTKIGAQDAFVFALNPTGTALLYSTYLGGTIVNRGWSIAVDSAGCAYVTGITNSPDFLTTDGAYQTTKSGPTWNIGDAYDQVYQDSFDGFIAKLNPTGTALLYSTFLGGSSTEQIFSIAVDSAGCAYVLGDYTSSLDFPTTEGAFQRTFGGGACDTFVAKLNPNGTSLVYSTYLGGLGDDHGEVLAVDSAGYAYITGQTVSEDFPVTDNAFQKIYKGIGCDALGGDAFVAKLNLNGTDLIYSTYLGGSLDDDIKGIAVDSEGCVYVHGVTQSTDFPTTDNAYQKTKNGPEWDGTPASEDPNFNLSFDAFVTKLNAAGSALLYSTYFGGSAGEYGFDAALGNGGFIIYGRTYSNDLPVTSNAYQKTHGNDSTDGLYNMDVYLATFVNPTQITTGSVTGDKGTTVDLSATLTEANTLGDAPLANKTVRFMVNGVFAGNATTDTNGVATLTYPVSLVGGNYTVQVFFDGDIDHLGSSVSGSLKVPQSSLWVRTSSNKANPMVGDTVVITFKLNNDGPDPASNVVMRFTVPEGMEYLGASKDIGNIAYDPVTRTVTWTVDSMPVGDPYFSVEMLVQKAAVFGLQPQIASGTYDPTITSSVPYRTLTTVEMEADTTDNSNNSVNAATITETGYGASLNAANGTVPMQSTGVPVLPLLAALLIVLSSTILPWRK